MHDPGSAIHQILPQFRNRRLIEIRQRFPPGEINDRQLGRIITELRKIRADKPIPLPQLIISEINPFFDVDDGRFPVQPRLFRRGFGKGIFPTRAGGLGSRFFSLRRKGVAGRGRGGKPSPALRRWGAALGGILALGFWKSSAVAASATVLPITMSQTRMPLFIEQLLHRNIFTSA
jgi:hypothetical protein